METVRMGKRGTMVVPAKLRKRFGLEDGSLLVIESDGGEIRLRPALAVEVEVYSPERKAGFYLNNAISKEDWDSAAADIRGWGLDPLSIADTDLNMRATLPTNRELAKLFDRIEAKSPVRRSA